MVINPSYTSGTSFSKSLSKKTGEVRDKITFGFPLIMSTRWTIDLTESPFLKRSFEICSPLGSINSLPSLSIKRISRPRIWYTSAEMISPTCSSYLLNRMSFSRSLMRWISVWRAIWTARLPNSSSSIFSYTSSPTSKSGSIFWASERLILSKSQISSELSSTISRILKISKSPLSALMVTSKFSSDSNFLRIIALNTSSRIRIMVGRSTFLDLANSAKDSIKIFASIGIS